MEKPLKRDNLKKLAQLKSVILGMEKDFGLADMTNKNAAFSARCQSQLSKKTVWLAVKRCGIVFIAQICLHQPITARSSPCQIRAYSGHQKVVKRAFIDFVYRLCLSALFIGFAYKHCPSTYRVQGGIVRMQCVNRGSHQRDHCALSISAYPKTSNKPSRGDALLVYD